jgi:hypothetical protein
MEDEIKEDNCNSDLAENQQIQQWKTNSMEDNLNRRHIITVYILIG